MNWDSGILNYANTPFIGANTTANRPPAASVPGLIFFDTTTLAIQRSDGATFQTFGGTPSAWINGGNSFGATASLGTNDAFGFDLKTSGVVRGRLRSTGELLIGNTVSSSFAARFEVDNAGVGIAAYFNGALVVKGGSAGEIFAYLGANYGRFFYNGNLNISTNADVNFTVQPAGVNRFRIVNSNGNALFGNPIPADSGASLQVAGDFNTAQPSASGFGKWKLGKKIAGAVALDAANYVEVAIDGVLVKLGIVV